MRYDVHLRAGINQRLDALAAQMRDWEATPRIDDAATVNLLRALQPFPHTTSAMDLSFAAAESSGDYPALSYGDAFVYVTQAQARCYVADHVSGLKELSPALPPLLEFMWIPGDERRRDAQLEEAFSLLAGADVEEVIGESDYRTLKAQASGTTSSVASLRESLIRPHASDAGNIAIQLRTTGALGAILRALRSAAAWDYILFDGTLSLPLVGRADASLFFEHLKRLCCVSAHQRDVALIALSRSHGLPSIDWLEERAQEALGLGRGTMAEHWYLRVPTLEADRWALTLAQGSRLPPPGAVTYLVRFHRTTPVLRLDMDRAFWITRVRGSSEQETRANERRLFADIDYASHDQRCYGYPYPLWAARDRVTLSQGERAVLRKQIIDAGVRAGMKRSLFRDGQQGGAQ